MIHPSIGSAVAFWLIGVAIHSLVFRRQAQSLDLRGVQDAARFPCLMVAFSGPLWWWAQGDACSVEVRSGFTGVLSFFIGSSFIETFSLRFGRSGRRAAYLAVTLGSLAIALSCTHNLRSVALPMLCAALLFMILNTIRRAILQALLDDSGLLASLRGQVRPWLLPLAALTAALYPISQWGANSSGATSPLFHYRLFLGAVALAVGGDLLIAVAFHVRIRHWRDSSWYRECLRALLLLIIGWNYFGVATGRNLGDLLVGSAFLSLGLGFAFRPTVGNLAAGLVLRLARPFAIGDTISIDKHFGRVYSIDWRSTSLYTLTGDLVEVPNTLIASKVIVVQGPPFWSEGGGGGRGSESSSRERETARHAHRGCWAKVSVEAEVRPLDIRKVLLVALKSHPAVLRQPEPAVFCWGFGKGGLEYRMLYWIAHVDLRPEQESAVLGHVLYHLRRAELPILTPLRLISRERE